MDISQKTVLAGAGVLTFFTAAANVHVTSSHRASGAVETVLWIGTFSFVSLLVIFLLLDVRSHKEAKRRKSRLIEFAGEDWTARYDPTTAQLLITTFARVFFHTPYTRSLTVEYGGGTLKARVGTNRGVGSTVEYQWTVDRLTLTNREAVFKVTLSIVDVVDHDIARVGTYEVPVTPW